MEVNALNQMATAESSQAHTETNEETGVSVRASRAFRCSLGANRSSSVVGILRSSRSRTRTGGGENEEEEDPQVSYHRGG